MSADALDADDSLVDVLAQTGLCSSRGDARRTLTGGGIRINGERVPDGITALPPGSAVDGRFVLLQKGKRQRHLLVVD